MGRRWRCGPVVQANNAAYEMVIGYWLRCACKLPPVQMRRSRSCSSASRLQTALAVYLLPAGCKSAGGVPGVQKTALAAS